MIFIYFHVTKERPPIVIYPSQATESVVREETPEEIETPKEEIKEPEKEALSLIKREFGNNWRIAYAVAQAESKLNPNAKGYNKGSIDRGIFQINSYWHKEVNDKCAFDLKCNIQEASRISKKGTEWRQWATFNNNLHLKYL